MLGRVVLQCPSFEYHPKNTKSRKKNKKDQLKSQKEKVYKNSSKITAKSKFPSYHHIIPHLQTTFEMSNRGLVLFRLGPHELLVGRPALRRDVRPQGPLRLGVQAFDGAPVVRVQVTRLELGGHLSENEVFRCENHCNML